MSKHAAASAAESVTSVADAHAAIDAACASLVAGLAAASAHERVPLRELCGRVLAEAVAAPFDQPRFDNSAMDGYAVRAADVVSASAEAPVVLEVAGVAAAGKPFSGTLGPGQAAQVMTGGVVPDGADAVVMVEHTSGYSDTRVEVRAAAPAGAHIRRAGEEIAAGTPLLDAGTTLGPVEIGTLATFGYADVAVRRRPRVAVFATGDELREPGEPLEPGQIYNSNFHVLGELCRAAGAEVVIAEVVRDDAETIARFLRDAAARCDVLISSGGVSMGRFDHVRDIARAGRGRGADGSNVAGDLGLQRRFWKVAQKPGRPLLFAADEGALFFGLPGNPVSSTICCVEYVLPSLYRLGGRAAPAKLRAKLAATFPREAKKHRFLFGDLFADPDGTLRCSPTRKLGSHMLTSGVGAGAILEAPAGDGPLEPGAMLDVNPLPWTTIAAADEPADTGGDR